MITITINNTSHQIPTSWDEVTFAQLCAEDPAKAINPHVPPEEIIVLSVPLPEASGSIDIGSESWDKLEQAKQHLSAESTLKAWGKVYQVYYGQEPDNLPVSVVYPAILHLMNEFKSFTERYKELYVKDDDADLQELAGVHRINAFGFFSTLFTITDGDPLKYEATLKLPAADIYHTLLMGKELSGFKERLQKLYKAAKITN